LPYHIGNGGFVGLLPSIAVAWSLRPATSTLTPDRHSDNVGRRRVLLLPETDRRDIRNIDALRGAG
jgi:hypothetical protein